jgi:hypothetical protein
MYFVTIYILHKTIKLQHHDYSTSRNQNFIYEFPGKVLYSYSNNLIDEQYTGDRNPFFDLDYDLQQQHAKHVIHILLLLSVPCLPSPYKKNASMVSVRKTAIILHRVCIIFVFTTFLLF